MSKLHDQLNKYEINYSSTVADNWVDCSSIKHHKRSVAECFHVVATVTYIRDKCGALVIVRVTVMFCLEILERLLRAIVCLDSGMNRTCGKTRAGTSNIRGVAVIRAVV